MDPEFEEDVEHWPTDTLVLGNSSWHGGADKSLKYAWPNKNGKWAEHLGESPSVLRSALARTRRAAADLR
jgi:hypothetical protein